MDGFTLKRVVLDSTFIVSEVESLGFYFFMLSRYSCSYVYCILAPHENYITILCVLFVCKVSSDVNFGGDYVRRIVNIKVYSLALKFAAHMDNHVGTNKPSAGNFTGKK